MGVDVSTNYFMFLSSEISPKGRDLTLDPVLTTDTSNDEIPAVISLNIMKGPMLVC